MLNTEKFIIKSKEIHKDLYTYGKTTYTRWDYPVTITCKEHGDFIVKQASEHISARAQGCQKCKNSIPSTTKSSEKLYYVWRGIKGRCYVKTHNLYKNYGKRGITFAKEFYESYEDFSKYVRSLDNYNKSMTEKYSLDRINNDGNYERGNLRWASKQTQVLNRRKVASLSGYTGIFKCKHKGRCYLSVIKHNYKKVILGYFHSLEEALSTRNNYIIKNNLKHKIQDYKSVFLFPT